MKYKSYNSFLVRIWQEHAAGETKPAWRGEIESIQTGQTWQFTRFEYLSRFIQESMESASQRAEDTPDID